MAYSPPSCGLPWPTPVVALAEQSLKLVLNVYRGWVAEDSVRTLRVLVGGHQGLEHNAAATGVEISIILDEVEPIGGFVGISVSEPLLQGGILVSVVSYMLYLDLNLALLALPSSCRSWCSCRCCRWRSTAARKRAS